MSLVLTVDVEDWAQSTIDTEYPITVRSRKNTEYLLDILSEYDRKVTCFVLGKFAEMHPECVKRIVNEGHEIASHGYGHIPLGALSPSEFREDLRRSKRILENISGAAVCGYRAPCFSVVSATSWALEIISSEGFLYDSSINPARAKLDFPRWPPGPVTIRVPSGGEICELPAATLTLLGREWPVAGGGYHRLIPWFAIRWAISRTLASQRPFVAYCHPYEFDPREFSQVNYRISPLLRMHQGIGRRGFETKFRKILGEFDSEKALDVALSPGWPVVEIREC